MESVREAEFPVDGLRATHYLLDAELSLVVCSGPRRGKAITYDLVDRRVPAAPPLPRDEALARLAFRYIAGHGPATEQDFAWWSGLGLTDARRGLNAAGPGLRQVSWEDRILWTSGDDQPPPRGFRWLAGFDEYLIAFADRGAALDPDFAARAFTANGIFFPVVLFNGRVAGVWKRQETARTVTVQVDWFGSPPPGHEDSRREWEQSLSAFQGRQQE